MKPKYIFLTIFFTLLFSFSFSTINAIDYSFCSYGEELNLTLPVTIGVHVKVTHPMNSAKDYQFNEELYVYNEETCNSAVRKRTINSSGYFLIEKYYYYYNGEPVEVDQPLGNGVYSEYDVTPPKITSTLETMTFSVDRYVELDYISVFINAFDDIDGNVIVEAIYDNYTPNYNKIGNYSIVFQACDKSNNCSTYNQKIKVHDVTPPTISGENKIQSYMSNSISLTDIGKNLVAIDNYDGDISTSIILEYTSYNSKTPGTYYAYYTIKDSSNNSVISPFKVEITVIDDIAPIIEGPTFYTNKLSSILRTSTILANIIVSDNSDNSAYKNIYIIDDNYTNNSTKIGEYTLVVGCYDKYGNESLPYIITINTIDEIPPSIDGANSYISYLSSPLSMLTIKSNLVVLDNYDGNLFNKLEIIEDTYTNNKNSIGIFNIIFSVIDNSNNSSTPFNVEIIVQDDIAPIIEGPSFYTVLNTDLLDVISIKNSLTAIDNIDKDISDTIVLNENSYLENHDKPGTYFLTFYAIDSSGNISNNFKVKITVNENLSYLDQINNSLIHLEVNKYKNDSEILSILGVNYSDYNSISTIENSYVDNYDTLGKFNIIYEFTNTDFTKKNIKINVLTYESAIDDTNTNLSQKNVIHQNKKKENFFSKILSFFKNIFINIWNFFKNLFR